MLYRRILIAVLAAAGLVVGFSAQAAQTASQPGGSGEETRAPTVLSESDIALYRRIVEVQEAGRWQEADKLIAQLDNDVLMGHVMFQRYMHPTDYRSKFSELKGWLAKYADLPGADRIHRLAMRRKPYDAAAPREPVPLEPEEADIVAPPETQDETATRLSNEVRAVRSRIRAHLRRGEPERAEKRLWATARLDLLPPAEFDEQANRIATSYLTQGKDEKAMALASLAAARSRKDVVTADWTAGLAAWRLGDYATAYQSFAALAQSETAGSWTQSAGGFWAARAAVKARMPQAAISMLNIAAEHRYTFYGLIAAEQLGIVPEFQWTPPVMTDEARDALMEKSGVARAVALRQIGMTDLADVEMKMAWSRSGNGADAAFLSMASYLNLPATQVALSLRGAVEPDTRTDAGLYPVPDWQPEGGFTVDRALIFAFMRQESLFDPQAVSWAGARGVMQLMPATASFIANDRSLSRVNRAKLFDPQFNMALGQKYLEHLMEWDSIRNNLFLMMVAYNGGPGNLGKWLKASNYGDDLLLFIETIPARETRIYVERVMANYWIYRLRLGEDVPSLSAVAAGENPLYQAQEYPVTTTASTESEPAP